MNIKTNIPKQKFEVSKIMTTKANGERQPGKNKSFDKKY